MIDETIKYPQMADAFPDFDQNSLPSIPPSWTDVSWHNDLCPTFSTGSHVIFIDYPASYQREFDGPRFSAHTAQNGVIDFGSKIATDNWAELLEWTTK